MAFLLIVMYIILLYMEKYFYNNYFNFSNRKCEGSSEGVAPSDRQTQQFWCQNQGARTQPWLPVLCVGAHGSWARWTDVYGHDNKRRHTYVSYVMYRKLMYRQSVCQTVWNDVMSDNRQEFTLRQYVQQHLSQSEDWIFCVSMVTCTCDVSYNTLSCICRSIKRHFKRSVDTLIDVFPERLKWCSRLWQMCKSMFPQTMHVCIARDTHNVQSYGCSYDVVHYDVS